MGKTQKNLSLWHKLCHRFNRFFSFFFLYHIRMNLSILLVLLLSAIMLTAHGNKPGADEATAEPGEAEKATARKNDRSAATERENAERGHHLREENIGPNDPDTSSHSAGKKLQAIAVDGNTERQSGSYGEVLKARYCYWGEPCKKSNEGKLWSHGCYKGYCWTQCSALGMIDK